MMPAIDSEGFLRAANPTATSATEKQYEFLKVSVPRTGVGMSKDYLNNSNPWYLYSHS